MLNYLEVGYEVEKAAEHLYDYMESDVRTAIADAQFDFYDGHFYHESGVCTYGFEEALGIIRKWASEYVHDIRVKILDSVECEACGGSGLDADLDAGADAKPCPDCDGAGRIKIEREERLDGTRERILEEILGRELARYIRSGFGRRGAL